MNEQFEYQQLKAKFPNAKNKHELIQIVDYNLGCVDRKTIKDILNIVSESMDFAFENGWYQAKKR